MLNLCQSEIEHLYAGFPEQYIFWLQVSMRYPLTMSGIQCFRHLRWGANNPIERHPPSER